MKVFGGQAGFVGAVAGVMGGFVRRGVDEGGRDGRYGMWDGDWDRGILLVIGVAVGRSSVISMRSLFSSLFSSFFCFFGRRSQKRIAAEIIVGSLSSKIPKER